MYPNPANPIPITHRNRRRHRGVMLNGAVSSVTMSSEINEITKNNSSVNAFKTVRAIIAADMPPSCA
jgi:hypothetical protein